MRRSTIMLSLCLLPLACSAQKTISPQTGMLVSGTYDTAVRLGNNTCGSVTVQDRPTTIAHTAGATTFTLTHVNNFTGTLKADATFTTAPLVLTDASATTTVSITGKFLERGLEADVRVQVDRAGTAQDCEYTVHWTGTKQGSPNRLQ